MTLSTVDTAVDTFVAAQNPSSATNNQHLCEKFGCGEQAHRKHKTKSIRLFRVKSMYLFYNGWYMLCVRVRVVVSFLNAMERQDVHTTAVL
ncbi:unnamed protein product [Peronospora belbahrii]|uniref:Uncharacterized protein n=1 Tax=Peronospora belbahrii TaxID=622444 RepID=A0AAU9KHR7_9STRA|nr:unnamed protein product [Peronospora belbahrii]CAH0517602.1 unnamed protein product [Peronospora belbahrii]